MNRTLKHNWLSYEVDELENCPFNSFDKLKEDIDSGKFKLGVSPGAALNWMINLAPKSKNKALVIIFCYLMFAIPASLIIYVIVWEAWLLLLSIPLLIVGYFTTSPVVVLPKVLKIGFTIISFMCLIFGFISGASWLIVISISLIAIWYFQYQMYHRSVDEMIDMAKQNEDFLCRLWIDNILSITMQNGDSYAQKWVIEDGVERWFEDKSRMEITGLISRADDGDAEAQYEVGCKYIDSQCYQLAVDYLERSAKQNYAEAQYTLGCLYYNSASTERNLPKAYAWSLIAEENGIFNAKNQKECVKKCMTKEQLTEAEILLADYKGKDRVLGDK